MSKRGDELVRRWSKQYKVLWLTVFDNKSHNKKYSKEFKITVVNEYLKGNGSCLNVATRFGIPNGSILLSWVNKYNSHIELTDYDPKPEVYMADTLKVSKEKKLEIINYCIDHNYEYKGTSELYGGNYAQIYSWVKKYELFGEESLEDHRGRRKTEEQLTDLDKAKRRIAELMKHRDAADSKRYRMLAKKFIEEYGVDTDKYDVIKGWRANASYSYIAKEFVRDNIDMDILEELLSLGGLGIQYCIKSELAYSNCTKWQRACKLLSTQSLMKSTISAMLPQGGKCVNLLILTPTV